ncbi:MAG: nucleoside recognition protein, partial [Lachnospiraceae bacterium]|nr:nucleoside recognition protein [Lachnospiraceae bacterium]
MLNYIWALMIMVGVIYGAMTGNIEAVSNAALDSAGEAVSLCITMMGVMALWVGLMEIAQTSGLIERLTKGIQPFISFMFPGIPKGHAAREYISMNIIANVLGLGWACTPAGLKAMEELAKLEAERGTAGYLSNHSTDGRRERVASSEMCTFLILNISSLQ